MPKGVVLDQRALMLDLYKVAVGWVSTRTSPTCTRRRCSTPPPSGASSGVKAWALERIAGFKVPKRVELRAEPLPLSGAMKG